MTDVAPKCPACESEYTYELNGRQVCSMCAHEWSPEAAEVEAVIKDSAGNVLADGDTVTVEAFQPGDAIVLQVHYHYDKPATPDRSTLAVQTAAGSTAPSRSTSCCSSPVNAPRSFASVRAAPRRLRASTKRTRLTPTPRKPTIA